MHRPSARRTCPRRAHGLCAPRAAGNQIGPEGAKELAAALKINKALTELDLSGACSDTFPPRSTMTESHGQESLLRAAKHTPRTPAAPTLHAPRTRQIIKLVPTEPRSWVPRSRTT